MLVLVLVLVAVDAKPFMFRYFVTAAIGIIYCVYIPQSLV